MDTKATISDVAERANVSSATVSRVLNGNGATRKTRERVLEVVEKLNYRPNVYAKGMRSSRKNCMGILMERSVGEDDPWLEKTVLAMSAALCDSDYRCMIDFWEASDGQLPHLLDNVDGVLLLGNYPETFFERVSESRSIPLVTFDEKMPYDNGASLKIDWQAGMRSAVQELLALQHQVVGLVSAGIQYPALQARYQGYLSTLPQFGQKIEQSLVACCEEMEDGGYHPAQKLTKELIERRPDVTAIIYGSDRMAFGGMETLRDAGLEVPGDVSVVGFDDTDWGRMMVPPLTSVGVDYHRLSVRLVEVLEGLLGERRRMPDMEIEPKLIRRKTTSRQET